MKKETLQEAAERFTYTDMLSWENTLSKASFIAGAKWQQERSYSEEELLEFANWCRIQDNKYPNRVITIQQLFTQFKSL